MISNQTLRSTIPARLDELRYNFGMENLECHAELIEPGTILRIAFSGFYPPGSEGTPVADAMSDYVSQAVSEFLPASILIDLSGLNYRWGNGIVAIVAVLVNTGWRYRLRCVCVLAKDETARAIRPLFEPNLYFGICEVKLFEDEQNAVAYLKTQASIRASFSRFVNKASYLIHRCLNWRF